MVTEAVQLVVVELGTAIEHFLRTCLLEHEEVYQQKLISFSPNAWEVKSEEVSGSQC